MDKFQLLHEFTEGNLSEEAEKNLFTQLSSDSSLRAELKQLMSVNATISLNRNNFHVPKEMKNNVFSTLGLPITQTGNALPPKSIGFFTSLFSNNSFFYSVLSSVASVVGVLLFLNFTGNLGEGQTKIITEYKDKPVYIEQNLADRSNLKKEESQNNSNPTIIYREAKPIIKYVYKSLPQTTNSGIFSNDLTFSHIPNFDFNNNFKIYKTNSSNQTPTSNSIYNNTPNTDNEIYGNNVEPENNELSKFTLEWKGAMNWNNPLETVSAAKYSKFTNNSLALSYNFTNKFSLGADLRAENFYQEFYFINDNGDQVNVKQLPQYTTYSGFARYRILNFDMLKNFVQISAGANTNGMVYRGMYGIEFTPYDKFGLVFGLEYSSMMFNYKNNNFNTGKFSLNYGLKYNF